MLSSAYRKIDLVYAYCFILNGEIFSLINENSYFLYKTKKSICISQIRHFQNRKAFKLESPLSSMENLTSTDQNAIKALMDELGGGLEKKLKPDAKLLDNGKKKGEAELKRRQIRIDHYKALHGYETDQQAFDLMERLDSGKDAKAMSLQLDQELKYMNMILSNKGTADDAALARFDYWFGDVKPLEKGAKNKYAQPNDLQRKVMNGLAIMDEYLEDNPEAAKKVAEFYQSHKLAERGLRFQDRIVKLALLTIVTADEDETKDSDIEKRMGCTMADVIKAYLPAQSEGNVKTLADSLKRLSVDDFKLVAPQEGSYLSGMKAALGKEEQRNVGYSALKTLMDQKYSAKVPGEK